MSHFPPNTVIRDATAISNTVREIFISCATSWVCQYLGDRFGNPSQRFQVLFDTDLQHGVFCSVIRHMWRHHRFDASASTSSNRTERSWVWGTEAARSNWVRRGRYLWGRVRQHIFAQVYQTRGNAFLTSVLDGIVGLALENVCGFRTTYIRSNVESRSLVQKGFTAYLSRAWTVRVVSWCSEVTDRIKRIDTKRKSCGHLWLVKCTGKYESWPCMWVRSS